jgi:hypothetical protein
VFGTGVADTGMKGAGEEGFTDDSNTCADEATDVKPKSVWVSGLMLNRVQSFEYEILQNAKNFEWG